MATIGQIAKPLYVRIARITGAGLKRTGFLAALDRRRDRRWAHWLRSLLAIHDVDEMIALDVPWWTYEAIDEVAAFLASRPDAKVFEYGSGASTVWLAKRAKSVHSVEHDAGWYSLMQDKIVGIDHVTLEHIPADKALSDDPLFHSEKPGHIGESFADYARAILKHDTKFDLIVIDGRGRAACLSVAQDALSPQGMIVFDNSRRARYQRAIVRSGMQVKHLAGLTPSLPYPDRTSLLKSGQPANDD